MVGMRKRRLVPFLILVLMLTTPFMLSNCEDAGIKLSIKDIIEAEENAKGGQATHAPAVPESPTVTAGNEMLAVSWTAVANAESYLVRWSNTLPIETAGNTLSVAETSVNITGLANGTTYYVWVSAVNAAGSSDYCQPATGTPSEDPAVFFQATPIDLHYFVGGALPPPRYLEITNIGGRELTGLSCMVTYENETGWLMASIDKPAAPAILTVQTATVAGSLGPGIYRATVTVESPVAVNSPRSVVVTLTVEQKPDLSLSASTLSFTGLYQGPETNPQTVAVGTTGGGTLTGLMTSIDYASGSNWLSASLEATTATAVSPAALTVKAYPTGLAAGTYGATIYVYADVASNTPQTITVSFNVTTLPIINLSPGNLEFNAYRGDGTTPAQTVTVANGGGQTLDGLSVSIEYVSGTGWLAASLTSTIAPANITVQASPGSLAEGTYSAMVSVSSASAANTPQKVLVSFTVTTKPAIGLSQSSLSFTAYTGGLPSASTAVNVVNAGGGSLTGLTSSVNYYGGPTGWLDVSFNTTTAPATMTVSANPLSLPAATYTATISVTADIASNAPQTISVSFTVTALPIISLSSSSLDFTAYYGGATTTAKTVSIVNAGGGGDAALTGLVFSTTYYDGDGWLSVSLNSTTSPATLTVQAIPGSLGVTTHTAKISISASGAANTPQDIAVSFTVVSLPVIAPSSVNLNFSAYTGSGNPAAQIVTVNNSGGGDLTGLSAAITYTNGSGWLSATLDNTNAPATLTVLPVQTTLQAGTYYATIKLSADIAANNQQEISVAYEIMQLPAISLSTSSLEFTGYSGAGPTAGKTVDIGNIGGGSLTGLTTSISYGSGFNWLTTSLDRTTAPATLTVQALPQALSSGTYTATIYISADIASNKPRTVDVSFTVIQPPIITPSVETISLLAYAGSTEAVGQTVSITNTGGGTLTGLHKMISYQGASEWLSVAFNSTTAPTAMFVSATAGALAIGTYNATILILADVASNMPREVGVVFTVEPAPGSLDISFNNDGLVTTMVTGGTGTDTSAMAIQSDGKILVAGSHNYNDNDLTRYNADGSPDVSFGANGFVTWASGSMTNQSIDIEIQNDGKILVLGTTTDNATILGRLTAAGALDASFGGGDGILTIETGKSNDWYRDMVLLADGNILLCGTYDEAGSGRLLLIRLTANGSLDAAFGTGGIATPPAAVLFANRMSILSNGFILLCGAAGSSYDDVFLARFSPNGILDTSFGGGAGYMTTSLYSSGLEIPVELKILPDEKVIIAGVTFVAKFTSSGVLDASFGTGGFTAIYGDSDTYISSMRIQDDGKIVLAGGGRNPSNYIIFKLLRYLPDGTPDLSFGTNGIVTTQFGDGGSSYNGKATAIEIQDDGMIVAAGGDNCGYVELARYWP